MSFLWVQFKNSLYVPFFLLGMSIHSFYILGVFILLDIITGMIRSCRIDGCRTITSKTFAFGITFKGFIVLVPLLVALAGKGVGMDLTFMARGALSMLILSEAYSILGNLYSIKTGVKQEEFDAVNWSIEQVRKTLLAIIKK